MLEFVHIATITLIVNFIAIMVMKRKKHVSEIIALGLLATMLLFNITFYLVGQENFRYGFFFKLTNRAVLLVGPLFWLQSLSLTIPDFQLKRSLLWHFLPFVLTAGITAPNEVFHFVELSSLEKLLGLFTIIQWPAYTILAIIALRRHQNDIPQSFSDTRTADLQWMEVSAWFMLTLPLSSILITSLEVAPDNDFTYVHRNYINTMYSVIILAFAYAGFRQGVIYLPYDAIPSIHSGEAKKGVEKYAKSGLTPAKAEKIYHELLIFMAEAKPFLDPSLSLFQLAKSLQVPSNHLSQVINTKTEQNFFDFINKYRVVAVKEELRKAKHVDRTLLAIAFDSGFNSKASFNRAFKKFTGMTPSTYANSIDGFAKKDL